MAMLGAPGWGEGNGVRSLGVDSFSILFNRRSFPKPAISPGFLERRILERMGKISLEEGYLGVAQE